MAQKAASNPNAPSSRGPDGIIPAVFSSFRLWFNTCIFAPVAQHLHRKGLGGGVELLHRTTAGEAWSTTSLAVFKQRNLLIL